MIAMYATERQGEGAIAAKLARDPRQLRENVGGVIGVPRFHDQDIYSSVVYLSRGVGDVSINIFLPSLSKTTGRPRSFRQS